jgi:hypothetical protein
VGDYVSSGTFYQSHRLEDLSCPSDSERIHSNRRCLRFVKQLVQVDKEQHKDNWKVVDSYLGNFYEGGGVIINNLGGFVAYPQ